MARTMNTEQFLRRYAPRAEREAKPTVPMLEPTGPRMRAVAGEAHLAAWRAERERKIQAVRDAVARLKAKQ